MWYDISDPVVRTTTHQMSLLYIINMEVPTPGVVSPEIPTCVFVISLQQSFLVRFCRQELSLCRLSDEIHASSSGDSNKAAFTDPPPNDGREWEKVVDREQIVVWQRPVPDSYVYEYKGNCFKPAQNFCTEELKNTEDVRNVELAEKQTFVPQALVSFSVRDLLRHPCQSILRYSGGFGLQKGVGPPADRGRSRRQGRRV